MDGVWSLVFGFVGTYETKFWTKDGEEAKHKEERSLKSY